MQFGSFKELLGSCSMNLGGVILGGIALIQVEPLSGFAKSGIYA
jgi:hypothetical protein